MALLSLCLALPALAEESVCSSSCSASVTFKIIIPKKVNRPLNVSTPPQHATVTSDGTLVSP